ncbi:MAG: ribulose-phosphate 3-epimerase [Oscillospiraceae bacterium]|nr:ribulose-phosphate 3-epimerase [Oscillospiraceae bacterium]
MKNYVSASILSADMLNLEKEVCRLKNSGIDMLHFDVMDGIFVNNITYGLPVLSAIRKITDMTLDVHLMITDPIRYVERFAENGADIISFHLESQSDTTATLREIKSAGAKAALAIKPATPAEAVYDYLPYLDMLLVMTVEPGFGGQSFMPDACAKVKPIRERILSLGIDCDVQVDGGIDSTTAATAKKAGANVLVSGSYLFRAENMSAAAAKLKEDSEC